MRWGLRTAQTDSSLQEDETMRAFDISPLLRSSIGFDHENRLFDLANRLDDNAVSYPPYKIEKRGEDAYRITMAVAGFKPDEHDVTVKENSLIVTGTAAEQPTERELTYHHRSNKHTNQLHSLMPISHAVLSH